MVSIGFREGWDILLLNLNNIDENQKILIFGNNIEKFPLMDIGIDSISRIKNGDKDAFEAFFKAHYSHLCAYANKIIKDTDSSEEIVQEMFVQYWQKKESLQISSSLLSYFFRSVHNSCLNHLKQKSVHKRHEEIIFNENKDDIYDMLSESDENSMEHKIHAAIDRMPTERRKVFVMNRFEDLSYKEIAAKLGISVKTVENQIGKALKYLREEFKGQILMFVVVLHESIHQFFK